ncbi:F0F1 ATP synthase subunit epsilon [Corynebacterium incognita]|uniref:ATP synthase epsilon chain n=1 Tax=Corynebacterium incognita TaxID=2754725 RepID=A0A7G7CP80_9CORY|nr:F0F1 ATP synthase subunit epsilon [Corynebacterium incognita]QNE89396.1 F0F1 ATP synthase subunit epsilon [Corynebacterium incognita]
MASITVELVSVDRLVWTGEATMVTAETTEGEIGVLPGHEPMLGQLVENGVVTITPADGERRVAAVQGGFLSVNAEKVTVLADWAIWSNEIDESQASTDVDSDDEIRKSRGDAALRALRRAKMTV